MPDLTYMDRDLIQIQKNVIARATERAKIETIYSMVKRKLSAPGFCTRCHAPRLTRFRGAA